MILLLKVLTTYGIPFALGFFARAPCSARCVLVIDVCTPSSKRRSAGTF